MDSKEKAPASGSAVADGVYDGGDDVNRLQHNDAKGNGEQAESAAERLFSDSINFLEQLRPSGPSVLTAITPDGTTTTIGGVCFCAPCGVLLGLLFNTAATQLVRRRHRRHGSTAG